MIYIINNTSLSARLAPKHTLMQDARLQGCKILAASFIAGIPRTTDRLLFPAP